MFNIDKLIENLNKATKITTSLGEYGYKSVSLSVQKANYAAKMYQKLGFKIVNENKDEWIMICHL